LRVVIIGNSAAGLSAAETVRRLDSSVAVTVVTDEPYPAYLRCLLAEVLAGEKEMAGIRLRPSHFYQKNRIDIVNTAAIAIDPENKRVKLSDGRKIHSDRLVIATGASPMSLGIEGENLDGIFTFRTYNQALEASKVVNRTASAVVVGGGAVGLKAAWTLHKKGVKVTIVEKSPQILIRQLDEEIAAIIKKEISKTEITVVVNACPASFKGTGRLSAVVLDNGDELPAELAIIAVGTTPNINLVKEAGGKTGKGIRVNEHLQTSVNDTYAAGDCIEIKDIVSGEPAVSALWPLAVEQGRCAAYNLMGHRRRYPLPLTNMTAFRFGGIPFISAGIRTGDTCLVRSDDTAYGAHRKLFFKDDKLVGYILIGAGALNGAGVYTDILKRKLPVGKLKPKLLEGNISAADLMKLI
jgi:nitrite reductase (NADH) large subunit